MYFLTARADVKCLHRGQVRLEPTQDLVTIDSVPVLVEPNPVGRPIAMCPNTGALIKPCLTTLAVARGYSPFIAVEAHAVVIDSLAGLTDGTPPGVVEYAVYDPGQTFVAESGGET